MVRILNANPFVHVIGHDELLMGDIVLQFPVVLLHVIPLEEQLEVADDQFTRLFLQGFLQLHRSDQIVGLYVLLIKVEVGDDCDGDEGQEDASHYSQKDHVDSPEVRDHIHISVANRVYGDHCVPEGHRGVDEVLESIVYVGIVVEGTLQHNQGNHVVENGAQKNREDR